LNENFSKLESSCKAARFQINVDNEELIRGLRFLRQWRFS